MTRFSGRLDKQYDVDLVIEKCYDNIAGIKDHFGLKQTGDY